MRQLIRRNPVYGKSPGRQAEGQNVIEDAEISEIEVVYEPLKERKRTKNDPLEKEIYFTTGKAFRNRAGRPLYQVVGKTRKEGDEKRGVLGQMSIEKKGLRWDDDAGYYWVEDINLITPSGARLSDVIEFEEIERRDELVAPLERRLMGVREQEIQAQKRMERQIAQAPVHSGRVKAGEDEWDVSPEAREQRMERSLRKTIGQTRRGASRAGRERARIERQMSSLLTERTSGDDILDPGDMPIDLSEVQGYPEAVETYEASFTREEPVQVSYEQAVRDLEGSSKGSTRRSRGKGADDPMYQQAVESVVAEQKATVKFVQEATGVSQNRAREMLRAMQAQNIVEKVGRRCRVVLAPETAEMAGGAAIQEIEAESGNLEAEPDALEQLVEYSEVYDPSEVDLSPGSQISIGEMPNVYYEGNRRDLNVIAAEYDSEFEDRFEVMTWALEYTDAVLAVAQIAVNEGDYDTGAVYALTSFGAITGLMYMAKMAAADGDSESYDEFMRWVPSFNERYEYVAGALVDAGVWPDTYRLSESPAAGDVDPALYQM